jgi:lipoprotein Spr
MKKILLIIFLFCSITAVSQYCIDSGINNFVKEWIGKPYRFGGEDKNGIDCSAFVQRFYKDVYGMIISRTCYYQYINTKRVASNDLQIGDILFFDSKRSPSGWHAGVYIGNDQFIHAANYKEGVKISCIDNPNYIKNFKGAGRL